jgi:Ca-activated chloride channel family protein
MRPNPLRAPGTIPAALLLLLAACGGGGTATPTPTAEASTGGTASASASVAATEAASPTQGTGEPGLDAPDEIAAGASFDVAWTGPNEAGDYVTIVESGATAWTNEPYFYTNTGSPGTLTAPVKAGTHELWYVSGADDEILARRDIEVLPFEGDLLGPAEVLAGTVFEVAWNGPNGPGDYVTIVEAGKDRWTNESYFYTNAGNPGTLQAANKAGAYELWYVTGLEKTITARTDITVLPLEITLDAPDSVAAGDAFEVDWTGPDGPGDYVTIVAAGVRDWTNESYFYTYVGNPGTLTAPATAGSYEIAYVTGNEEFVFWVPITVGH